MAKKTTTAEAATGLVSGTKQKVLNDVMHDKRRFEIPKAGDERLGALKELPGIWKNEPDLKGRGWNIIALPFISSGTQIDYRILVNQYNEELKFTRLQGKVPNRGVLREDDDNLDQFLIALDYEQSITQLKADDFPKSSATDPSLDRVGGSGAAIHHEPGLWLNMLNQTTNNIDIARLATIPHGDSVIALGRSEVFQGAPIIPFTDTLPIGATRNICSGYLAPYRHFSDVDVSNCPDVIVDPGKGKFEGLLDVLDPADLLRAGTPANVIETTKLEVTTEIQDAGIVNIPFIVKHANASEMNSTFWIMKTDEEDENGSPVFIMQYMQVVMLDFFARFDGEPGKIKWPHISFNTLKRFPLEL